MSDFDQLERDLSRQLREVGAAARPPADAWGRFARRLESGAATTEQLRPAKPGWDRINDRHPSHEMEIAMRSNEVAPSRRRWPLLGAAAGLIAVAVVGVALAARDTDEPAPPVATAPPPAPTTLPALPPVELRGAGGNPDATEAFTTVSAAFEAFNTGDTAGWAIPVSAERNPEPNDSDEPADLGYTEARQAAGARFENGSCDYQTLAADPPLTNQATEGPVARHQFECSVTYVDAFTIAAGIDAVEEYAFVVADDGTPVETFNSGPDPQLRSFMIGFWAWLAREDPVIADSMGRIDGPNYPVAEDIPEALSLLDEFVAASDR